jgi:hypothetical protein
MKSIAILTKEEREKNAENPLLFMSTLESIVITDEEMPELIRGPWKSSTFFLRNGTVVTIGSHSDAVADIIEASIRQSNAETREDVLKALSDLAEYMSDPGD